MSKYLHIKVESYIVDIKSGHHGDVHIRPLEGQDPYLTSMNVRCSKELSDDYPVGTKFIIKIKEELSTRQGGKQFISSFHSWRYEVLR